MLVNYQERNNPNYDVIYNRIFKYIRKNGLIMKKEKDKSTNLFRDFNTHLSIINRPIIQETTSEIVDQENTTLTNNLI